MPEIEYVELAGGQRVPAQKVEALRKFVEEEWPGAVFPGAIPAVVWVVLNA